MDCIFCKIVSGEIPSHKLYEDEQTIALLDVYPANPGHTLVLPKAHYQDLAQIPEGALQQAIGVAKRLAPAIMRAVGAEGCNLFLNNGRAAGQLIEHLHLHILPRSSGDGLRLHLPQKPYPEGEAERISHKIMSALGEYKDKMDQQQLKQELPRVAPEGKIPCQLAFELAEKYNISRLALGELLNQLKIKIVNCQLGCF